ncbi:MAG: hypothetical protein HYX53_06650 [Chloroflexi bacterium]|nr:hypothetical protein [Chloroflexota bacterium]
MTASLDIACSVCSELLESHTEAYCMECGKPYHLNQRTDLEGKDCGEVWVNDDHLSLEFACNICLHPEFASAALDDILDLEEAALAAGISPAALAAAAASGQVRHRRTASGTLLFARRDLQPPRPR